MITLGKYYYSPLLCSFGPENFWNREAEARISRIEGLKSAFVRPGHHPHTSQIDCPMLCCALRISGFIYSTHDRPHLNTLKDVFGGLAKVNQHAGGILSFLGAASIPPLDVATVARAVINVALDEHVQGPLEVQDIIKLAG